MQRSGERRPTRPRLAHATPMALVKGVVGRAAGANSSCGSGWDSDRGLSRALPEVQELLAFLDRPGPGQACVRELDQIVEMQEIDVD